MVGTKTRYSQVEHTALTLKDATRKLHPYFHAHQVIVLTNQLFRVTLHKLDLSKRMLKWVIELSKYEIKY